jgi:hypothetical protein
MALRLGGSPSGRLCSLQDIVILARSAGIHAQADRNLRSACRSFLSRSVDLNA